MKRHRVYLFVIVSVLVMTGSSAWAKDVDLHLTAGLGWLSGETDYQIGGTVVNANGTVEEYHFPFSELKWPMDVYVASMHADAVVADTVHAKLEVTKNISRAAGWIKDSDWILGPDSFDVYSESRTRMDALLWDAAIDYMLYRTPTTALMVGIGYLHQYFEYTADHLYQEYPSGAFTGDNEYPGRVFTYDMTYEIPYLDFALQSHGKRFIGHVHFGWSPYASAEDEDHHLARVPVKVCKGESEHGTAYLAGVKADFPLDQNWSLGFQFDYKNIRTDGYQKQWDGGVYSAKLDWKSHSEQMMTLFTVGYSF